MFDKYFSYINWFWIFIGLVIFLLLTVFKIIVPYGRHNSGKWGKTMDNHWGWFWMELPALLLFPVLVFLGPGDKGWRTYLLVILWTVHYFNRTIIFPFRLKTMNKRIPLIIVIAAFGFNSINSLLNGYYLGFLVSKSNTSNFLIIAGILLYMIGFYINTQTDKKLISLRNESSGYKIPEGWLFKYISCPNHFGEIIEWIGFAIAAWNLPAASFAIWTFCNLAPRALNHHNWYKSQFDKYPAERNALIPFIW